MHKFFQTPLEGKPLTWEDMDAAGHIFFRIKADGQTPILRMVADKVAPVVAIPFGIYCLAQAPANVQGIAAGIALWVAGWYVLRTVLRMMLERTTQIRMDAKSINVRRWWGWRSYDRQIEHGFEVVQHDWTRWEFERHDLAQRKAGTRGKVIHPTQYFQKSFHVVLRHAGQRRDLLTIYGDKKAIAIRDRLEYCDRRLNDAAGMAGGMGESPKNDWKPAAGGL